MRTMIVQIWIFANELGDDPKYFGTLEEAEEHFRNQVFSEWNEHHLDGRHETDESEDGPYKLWEPPCYEMTEPDDPAEAPEEIPEAIAANERWWSEVVALYSPDPVPRIPPYPGFEVALALHWGVKDADLSGYIKMIEVVCPVPADILADLA